MSVIGIGGMCVFLAGCGKQITHDVQSEQAQQIEQEEQAQQTQQTEQDRGILSSFTATDLEGNEVTQDIFADYDLTMVNMWATFCGPCIREMPELAEIQEEYAPKGVQVVGIVVDTLDYKGNLDEGQIETVKMVVEKTGAAYTHLLPSADLIQAKVKDVSSVPETIFVDKEGNQVGESYVGSRSKEQWIEIITTLQEQIK